MAPRHRDILESGVCLAILTAIALAALGPAWRDNGVPFSTDYAFTLPPWREAAPSDLSEGGAALSKAQALRYFPWYRFISDSATRDDTTLWYPLEGGGLPFLAAWRTRCLSPFTIPFHLFTLPTALRLSALLKLLAAGWGAFYLGRRIGLRAPFALLGAVAFELGGPAYLRTAEPISDVVAWLPLLVLFAEQLASGYRRAWPFGALVWALMLFGGDPESAVACAQYFVLYLALRFALERPEGSRVWLGTGSALAALAVGTALASVQVVPFAELKVHARSLPGTAVSVPLGWADLAILAFPRFIELRSAGDAARFGVLPLLHIGPAIGIMLAVWPAARRYAGRPLRSRVGALVWSAAAMTGLAFAQRFPPLSELGTEHYLAANALAFGVAAAHAGEHWLALNAKQCAAAVPRILEWIGAGAVLFAGLGASAHFFGSGGVEASLGGIALAVALGIGTVALLTVTLLRPYPRLLGYGLSALAAAGLWAAWPGTPVFSPFERLFPETRPIAAMKETGQRIAGSAELEEWPLAGNGIPQFYTSGGIALERQSRFETRLRQDPLLVRRTGSTAVLLSKEDIQGPFSAIRESLIIEAPEHVFDSGAVLFHDQEAAPRARMVYTGRALTPDAPAVSSDQPPLMESGVATNQSRDPQAWVEILGPAENGRVRIRVEQAHPGVLVLADAWYPGWRVAVDGQEKQAFPVDLTFRGVVVSEGTHEVEFIYDPLSVELGVYLSAAAGLLVVSGLVVAGLSRAWRPVGVVGVDAE